MHSIIATKLECWSSRFLLSSLWSFLEALSRVVICYGFPPKFPRRQTTDCRAGPQRCHFASIHLIFCPSLNSGSQADHVRRIVWIPEMFVIKPLRKPKNHSLYRKKTHGNKNCRKLDFQGSLLQCSTVLEWQCLVQHFFHMWCLAALMAWRMCFCFSIRKWRAKWANGLRINH